MASVGRTLRRWTVFRSLPLSPYSCGRTVVRMSSTRMVRLDSRRLLRVVGEDKGSVLQGLVTNDLTTSQSVQYTMLLNPQGKVLYETLVYKEVPGHPDQWLLECCSEVQTGLVKHLQKYILRAKVQVEPCNEFHVNWVMNSDLLSDDRVVIATSDPRVGALGARVITRASSASAQDTCSSEPEDEYTLHRLRVGVAEGREEVPVADCFPLEYNLDFLNGVSFDKGCYIGQELTARTHHTGVVRKRVVPITFGDEGHDRPLPPGTTVYSDKGRRVGKVIVKRGRAGLGLIRLESQGPLFTGEPSTERKLSVTFAHPPWWPSNL